ncbi:MAG: hypothetical protein AAF585_23075, partial [Verrucomicrobiota bacterium]
APVIAVVRAGEPFPEQSRDAFVKPSFPPNLPPDAIRGWIEARDDDWADSIGAAVMAKLLGKRPEQLAQHAMRGSSDLVRQRRFATLGAAAGILAAIWISRDYLHQMALDQVPGYAENIAPHLARFVNTTGPSAAPTDPDPEPMVVVERDPFDETMNANAEARQAALRAWLDLAEENAGHDPDEALRWIGMSRRVLETFEDDDAWLNKERYRFHALSARLAREAEDFVAAKTQLKQAIGFLTEQPLENEAARDEEAFLFLEAIAGDEFWMENTKELLNWLEKLPAEEDIVLARAERVTEMAKRYPELGPRVETMLSNLEFAISPKPRDKTFVRGRLGTLRSSLALAFNEPDRAETILNDLMVQLESAPATPLTTAAKANLELESLRQQLPEDIEQLKAKLARIAEDLDGNPEYATSLFSARVWLADLLLAGDEFENAAQMFESALDLAPEAMLVDTILKTACAWRYAGDHETADQAFNAVRKSLANTLDDPSLLTAVRGCILSAQALGNNENLDDLASEAAMLMDQMPDYEPPPYWRDLDATVAMRNRLFPEELEPETASTVDPDSDLGPLPVQDREEPAIDPVPPKPMAETVPEAPIVPVIAEVGTNTPEPEPDPAPKPESKPEPEPEPAPEPESKPDPEPEPKPVIDEALESEIAALQLRITALEAEKATLRNFSQLQELHDLYEELNKLLRKRVTGSTEPALPEDLRNLRPASGAN